MQLLEFQIGLAPCRSIIRDIVWTYLWCSIAYQIPLVPLRNPASIACTNISEVLRPYSIYIRTRRAARVTVCGIYKEIHHEYDDSGWNGGIHWVYPNGEVHW